MKHYQFKMRDEYGNESIGNVDADGWKSAWAKLCVLIRAGNKILVVNDLDEPEEEVEASDMSILQLVKKGEDALEIEESEALFQLSFVLLSGEQINVCAKAGLVDRVSEWFHNPEDVYAPPTISLMVEDSIVSLDRMFVEALFATPLNLDDYEDTLENDEGDERYESIIEQGEPTDGSI